MKLNLVVAALLAVVSLPAFAASEEHLRSVGYRLAWGSDSEKIDGCERGQVIKLSDGHSFECRVHSDVKHHGQIRILTKVTRHAWIQVDEYNLCMEGQDECIYGHLRRPK